jgi:dienelactone hydrolase
MNRREFVFGASALAASLPRFADAAGAGAVDAETAATGHGYQTLFYKSGGLNIEAYLFRPAGDGPFPFVIYNHGSRAGQEKQEIPFRYVADPLRKAGYVVVVPERRGYGKSDGTAAGGSDPVAGLEVESDDVLAALDFARTLPIVDQKRMGIMGWSFGGIVTMFTLTKTDAFRCAVDQAGGALSWNRSADVRTALTAAAAKVKIPVFFMDAQNDATTAAVTTCAAALAKNGVPHQLKIYPPFNGGETSGHIAPGHLIFGMKGVDIWFNDALAFLNANLA